MAKHVSAVDSDPVLSRKRTADLLKQLRGVTRELRSLKARVAELERHDTAASFARDLTNRKAS
jgi:hypothetical protein